MNAIMRTVCVVDDDEAARDSLSVLLRSEGLTVIGFDSAESCLAADLEKLCGCLIVDIHMPGLSGLELQAELRRRRIDLPIIVITGQSDVAKAVTALKGGAVDFLEKPYKAEPLLTALRESLDRAGRQQDQAAKLREIEAKRSQLSPREEEVMALMVSGPPNKVIASRLGISPRTVENHRAKIFEKMGCGNLSELIHLMLASNRAAGQRGFSANR